MYIEPLNRIELKASITKITKNALMTIEFNHEMEIPLVDNFDQLKENGVIILDYI